MSGEEPCDLLEWDSEFFGFRIGRLRVSTLTPGLAARACEWALDHSVECLYCLVDGGDAAGVRVAEDRGCRLVDVRVTRSHALEGALAQAPGIEPMREEDLPAVLRIAGTSHLDTRFYADPRFPRERCQLLYQRWIERSWQARDPVWVAREGGSPLGYVACALESGDLGRIGLLATAAEARGRGLGQRLLVTALAGLSSQGCRSVEAVGQARGLAAARLYERLGFRTTAVGLWYHWWLDEGRAG